MNRICYFLAFFYGCLFAKIEKEQWSAIQVYDTLEVLLNDQHAGVFYSGLTVLDSAVEIFNILDIGTTLNEKRMYRFDGLLINAEQKMSSSSGENYWQLFSRSDVWTLAVTAGGVKRQKNILPVRESIYSLFEIYHGVMDSSLKIGNSWNDTAFEITSGEYVFTNTECKEKPCQNNGFTWVFVSKNNIDNRDEVWRMDKNGKTVYREIYPFICRVRDYSLKSECVEQADLFEAFKISVTRKADPAEKILLTIDTSIQMDTSVLSYYRKTAEGYLLEVQRQECISRLLNKKNPDSLLIYTLPTTIIQSDHPDIIKLSRVIKKNEDNLCTIVKMFNDSVFRMIRKRNTATFSSAVETLKSGFGDCGEHAVLLAALLRAAGIPARVVMGLVYMDSRKGYYYHAWVSVYTGMWVFADPSHGLFPADHDRIPLMLDDSGERLLQLSRLIGRIKIGYRK